MWLNLSIQPFEWWSYLKFCNIMLLDLSKISRCIYISDYNFKLKEWLERWNVIDIKYFMLNFFAVIAGVWRKPPCHKLTSCQSSTRRQTVIPVSVPSPPACQRAAPSCALSTPEWTLRTACLLEMRSWKPPDRPTQLSPEVPPRRLRTSVTGNQMLVLDLHVAPHRSPVATTAAPRGPCLPEMRACPPSISTLLPQHPQPTTLRGPSRPSMKPHEITRLPTVQHTPVRSVIAQCLPGMKGTPPVTSTVGSPLRWPTAPTPALTVTALSPHVRTSPHHVAPTPLPRPPTCLTARDPGHPGRKPTPPDPPMPRQDHRILDPPVTLWWSSSRDTPSSQTTPRPRPLSTLTIMTTSTAGERITCQNITC